MTLFYVPYLFYSQEVTERQAGKEKNVVLLFPVSFPFLRHEKILKHSIFKHKEPVYQALFYYPAFQFWKKIAVSDGNFKTPNDICLHQKVPKIEKKIRFALEIPV